MRLNKGVLGCVAYILLCKPGKGGNCIINSDLEKLFCGEKRLNFISIKSGGLQGMFLRVCGKNRKVFNSVNHPCGRGGIFSAITLQLRGGHA